MNLATWGQTGGALARSDCFSGPCLSLDRFSGLAGRMLHAACPGGIVGKGPRPSLIQGYSCGPCQLRHPFPGTCVPGLSPTFYGGELAFRFGAWL